jgi:hypothetical protein
MAEETFAGNLGGFLQVDADDERLMTSQVSMPPPQMSSLEKPLNKISRLGLVGLGWVGLGLVVMGWVAID